MSIFLSSISACSLHGTVTYFLVSILVGIQCPSYSLRSPLHTFLFFLFWLDLFMHDFLVKKNMHKKAEVLFKQETGISHRSVGTKLSATISDVEWSVRESNKGLTLNSRSSHRQKIIENNRRVK